MRRSFRDVVYGSIYFVLTSAFFVVNLPAKLWVKTTLSHKIVKRNCVHE
ncbi:MAG: hypothetical protein HYW48_05975 [Deltaproteobacteria bacterium]|nr:hypothetical protein [Deltaproteobacteria bacterium]